VLAPTFAVAVDGVFLLRKIAASVFPWSKATPLPAAQSMDAATASSPAPSAHQPMSSTKDRPRTPGTAASTPPKIPDSAGVSVMLHVDLTSGTEKQ